MRKRINFLILVFFAFHLGINAEHALVVQLIDGNTHSYVLAEKPVVKMVDGLLKIKSSEVVSEYPMTSVENFHFTEITHLDISKIMKNELRFVRDGKNLVTIYGENENISVYSISGQKQAAAIQMNGSQTQVNLSSMPDGMYIIKANKQSFKISK
jgi:hypothetical protein